MLRDHLPMNMEKALRQAVSAYTNGNGAEAAPLPVTNEEDSDVQPIISWSDHWPIEFDQLLAKFLNFLHIFPYLL